MRRSLSAAALGTLLVTAACGGGSGDTKADSGSGAGASKPGATVDMTFTLFKQTDVTLKAGETLTFVNQNPITHIIVQGDWMAGADGLRTSEKDDGTYKLDVSKKGDKVEHTFDKAGTFKFFCTIHKGMSGAVTVT